MIIELTKITESTGIGCRRSSILFSKYCGIDFKIVPMGGLILGYYCFFKDEADAIAFKLQWI